MEKVTVAQFIARQLSECEKTQKAVAQEIGYENPNVITMIKQGATKLPITKVGPLARSLRIDPIYLLRLVLCEYAPESWAALDEILGARLVSEGELRLLKHIRDGLGGAEVDLDDPRQRAHLDLFLEIARPKAVSAATLLRTSLKGTASGQPAA